MTLATIVNRLLAEGSIERVRVNRYRINNSMRVRDLNVRAEQIVTLSEVHTIFATGSESEGYRFRRSSEYQFIPRRYRIWQQARTEITYTVAEPRRPEPERQPLRTINRGSYHSHGDGTHRTGIEEALRAIPAESDGVRRSYGLEWEIYALSATQEDKLARLLDTLPRHFTESDGSLSSRGVEIVFLPLGRDKIKEVWVKLQTFCHENGVDMQNTGAHLTYGVNNTDIIDRQDLQIRLNRVALAIKASSTQQAIRSVFGRDFTGYACLPSSTTQMGHSMSFSASRGNSAYELRLCNWQGDIEKITAMMDATEFVFHRVFTAQDFMNIFTVMGADCSGI